MTEASYIRNLVPRQSDIKNNTSTTIAFFEEAEMGNVIAEEVDPEEWYTDQVRADGLGISLVSQTIGVDRHLGELANYLYHDGHISTIHVQIVRGWLNRRHNFLDAGSGLPPFRK
ncbi:MAG: hypothetical protein AAF664_21505 [Planctomycetota bacterium]